MKKLLYFLLLVSTTTFAQVPVPPQGISHRGVAYKLDGTLITNVEIQIKISIFDDSATGVLAYSETHYPITPNNLGQYSLNIGAGTPVTSTVTFNTIDWGSEHQKWLKVEIFPPAGQGTTPVVGTNQLMSVPYALYSEKSNSDVKTVNNISDLRAITTYVDNQIVYLKGYYSEGDGGEGFFIFRKERYNPAYNPPTVSVLMIPEDTLDTGGIHIKPQSIENSIPGRWVRQYDGPINAIYFGIVKFPQFTPLYGGTNSDRIDAAINYIHANTDFIPNYIANVNSGDMTLYFPDGVYFTDRKIVLWSQIQIIGGKGTKFQPSAGFEDSYMFEVGSGPIVRVNLENIIVNTAGYTSTDIGGIHIKGDNPDKLDLGSGAWIGTFKNLKMDTNGHGIYLEGGNYENGNQYEAPNQYLVFESVDLIVHKPTSNGLKITGEFVNSTFLNCQFEIPFAEARAGGNVGTNISITNTDSHSTIQQVSFINCAAGGGLYACQIENASNVNFDGCWFEYLERSFDIKNSSAINIQNSRFANAAGRGSLLGSTLPQGSGSCITVENSFVNIENNHTLVSEINSLLNPDDREKFILGIGNTNTINARNNSFQDIRLSESYGITQEVTIQNVDTNYYPTNFTIPGINTDGKKAVLVTAPTINQIFRINSTIAAGETISIRAHQGTITFWSWNPAGETTGKNIYMNGRNSLTLTNGQIATFIKLDGANGNEKCVYQLLSVDKVNSTSSFSFTGSTIDSSSNSYIYVTSTTPNTIVNQFQSNLNPGETLTIKAANTIKFDSSKNLILSTVGSIVLDPNETATFMRTGLPITSNSINYTDSWQLISTNRENLFSSGTTTTIAGSTTTILKPAGTYNIPSASAVPIGTTYVFRNTSTGTVTTSNLIINTIIDFNASTATAFTLTPTIGSISIVSDGINWYRIN